MFRGLAACSIDTKGRITVPASYRKQLIEEADGKLVLTIDTEVSCLLLYPLPRWLIIEQQLENLPGLLPATRRIQRLLIGHATDLELDRQGRVLLPNLLREYAGLDKSVMWVGQGQKVEIWAEARWKSEREKWLSHNEDKSVNIPPELQSLPL